MIETFLKNETLWKKKGRKCMIKFYLMLLHAYQFRTPPIPIRHGGVLNQFIDI